MRRVVAGGAMPLNVSHSMRVARRENSLAKEKDLALLHPNYPSQTMLCNMLFWGGITIPNSVRSSGASGGSLHGGAGFKGEKFISLDKERVWRTAKWPGGSKCRFVLSLKGQFRDRCI